MQQTGCVFDTMGLWLRVAQDRTVQKNINDICCTWKWGITLPLGIPQHNPFPIVSASMVNVWELQRHKETGSQSGERQFAQRPCLLQTCLCFLQKLLWLSGESLTDSSLYASLLCDSYHTTESSVLRCSSPFYSEGRKYIFPHCRQTCVFHSLHVWRRNEYHRNEIHTKEDNPTK